MYFAQLEAVCLCFVEQEYFEFFDFMLQAAGFLDIALITERSERLVGLFMLLLMVVFLCT